MHFCLHYSSQIEFYVMYEYFTYNCTYIHNGLGIYISFKTCEFRFFFNLIGIRSQPHYFKSLQFVSWIWWQWKVISNISETAALFRSTTPEHNTLNGKYDRLCSNGLSDPVFRNMCWQRTRTESVPPCFSYLYTRESGIESSQWVYWLIW